MYITHVDSESGCLGVLLVLEDDRVTVDGLLVQSIGVVHVCEVVEHIECQVNVHLIQTAGLLS